MSENLTPVFRLEHFIKAAADGTPCDLAPVFNEEVYLAKIAGADIDDLPAPVNRVQLYLAAIAGMDVEIPDPVFRNEMYLAAIAGMDIDPPAPVFRDEQFLADWAESATVLPDGITKVSYIQTTGGSYIITPIYLAGNSQVEMDFEFTDGEVGNLFGCYKSSTANNNFSIYRARPGASAGSASYTRYDGKLYRNANFTTARHNIVMNGEGLWIDGVAAEVFDTATFTADAKLYICALANSSAARTAGKIFRFKVAGVFDGIPVKKADGDSTVYGLYDKIGEVFYPSNGEPFTGE